MTEEDQFPPEYRLGLQKDRLHILNGFIAAFEHLDEIERAVRKSRSSADAVEMLMSSPLGFSESQAHHLLDLTLRQQTQENRDAIVAEREALRRTVGDEPYR